MAVTIISPNIFGNICLNIIFICEHPLNFAACIYAEFFIVKTCPLARRENFGQEINDKEITALTIPPPSTPATAMANTIPGNAKKISEILITNSSSFPPI